jgi:hypothetical protein
MIRNFAGQSIGLYAFDATTQTPKTGDAANIQGFWNPEWIGTVPLASPNATETDAVHAPGWYQFDVAQSETDEDVVLFTAVSTTPNVVIPGMLVTLTPKDFTRNVWDQDQIDHMAVGSMGEFLAAIAAVLAQFAFTVPGRVDANVKALNDTTLHGNGAGTPWGP